MNSSMRAEKSFVSDVGGLDRVLDPNSKCIRQISYYRSDFSRDTIFISVITWYLTIHGITVLLSSSWPGVALYREAFRATGCQAVGIFHKIVPMLCLCYVG